MTARGDTGRRVLAGGLIAAGLLAVVVALRAPAAAPAGPTTKPLATPLWSPRRAPRTVADAVADLQLQRTLTARIGNQTACFTVHDATGARAEAGGTDARIPASTLKLTTATAALDHLGGDHRFTTLAAAPGPVTGGTLDRLYLVGGGDPLLATPERIALLAKNPEYAGLPTTPLATLADRIAATGVRRIPGGVVGVDDRYDRTRYHPSWTAGTRAASGPIGALTVNDGNAGPAGAGPPVADPALNAAAELSRLLTARGIQMGPAARADRAPTGTTKVASIDSPALTDILTEMLSASDNLTAEMLTRELAYQQRPGTPGTTAAGVQIVMATIDRLGVDTTGLVMVDGSGLSRDDRIRCPTLLALVDLARTPKFAAIGDGLAIAGRRGTLADRLVGTKLAGNLTAKTGTLDGVSALAGYVTADRPLRFAFVVEGPFGEPGAFAIRESLATAIASYGSDFPDTAVPAPAGP